MHRIAVVEGDGIGPEVVRAALSVLYSMDLALEATHLRAGLDCHRDTGEYLPEATLKGIGDSDSCLLGALTSAPQGTPCYRPVIPAIRKALDLYANIRPVRRIVGEGPDIIIVRENTEGLYVGQERQEEGPGGDTHYISVQRYTGKGIDRISRFALDLAMARGRKRVTCIHKANVLRVSDGAFRKRFFEIAAGYPELTCDELFVDAAAMFMVTDPARFDVIVTTNLYGDILSDEAAGLVGGLGLAPSANIGEKCSFFEPVHGSAPDIAGKGIANPTATMLAAAMMLEHLGKSEDGERIRSALRRCYEEGLTTPDQGGSLSTGEFAREVAERV